MPKDVMLLGTLDTKGEEYGYVKDKIVERGHKVIVIDTGVLGQPTLPPDISREEVAKAGGTTIDKLLASQEEGKVDEGKMIKVMAEGAKKIVAGLYQTGKLSGILSLGGSMGTSLCTAAMRELPFGVPKVMVSTVASGDIRPYIGIKDIVMIPSVSDIVGLNRITKNILNRAAGIISSMVEIEAELPDKDKPTVGISVHGDLVPCMHRIKKALEDRGYEVIVFHAVGSGGDALEDQIRGGLIDGVIELVVYELTASLFGGMYNAGPDRFENAGKAGIPALLIPGKASCICYNPALGIPDWSKGRGIWMHNPEIAVTKTNEEEATLVGKVLAEKLNRAKGPTLVLFPNKGLNGFGKGWEEPAEANLAFLRALKKHLRPDKPLVEIDAHINDEIVTKRAVSLFEDLMSHQVNK